MKPKTQFANGQNPFSDCPVWPVDSSSSPNDKETKKARGDATRQKIMDVVAEYGAISRRMLSDKLKISKCSVDHQTGILIGLGLITERKGGRGESIYELAKKEQV
jgi:DNA-binding transcriptional ArsR family regulator